MNKSSSRSNGKNPHREHHTTVMGVLATLASFLIALVALSGNLTGNVVGVNYASSLGVGVVFFIIGIFGAIVLLRTR